MKDNLVMHISKFVKLDEQETKLVCQSVNLVTFNKNLNARQNISSQLFFN